MKQASVSTGMSFVDLLAGSMIGLVILYLISPTNAGSNPNRHRLELLFLPGEPQVQLGAILEIDGVKYASDDVGRRDFVRWQTNSAVNSLRAVIDLDTLPTIAGHVFVADASGAYPPSVTVQVQSTTGYEDAQLQLSLERLYLSSFRLVSE